MQLLRTALRVDAAVSAVSAAVLVAATVPVARFAGVDDWVPATIGLAFVPWVALLVTTARREPVPSGPAVLVIAGNAAWVAASAVLVLGFPDALTTGGRVATALVALVVADLAVAQAVGLRRARPQASASTKNRSAWQATSPST